jgi:alkyl hydroperoxide reductase subunit AhpC
LHENLEKLEGLDVTMYIISKDTPAEQLQLYNELEKYFGKSVSFVSDPKLKLIDSLGMKNGDVANRGYAMIDTDGHVIFNTVNDHWGEQFDQTLAEIEKEYNNLK